MFAPQPTTTLNSHPDARWNRAQAAAFLADFVYAAADRVVPASYGAQQQFATHLEQALGDFEDQERSRLAATMRPKTIRVCEDETEYPIRQRRGQRATGP